MRILILAALLAACSGPAATPEEPAPAPKQAAKLTPPLAVVVVVSSAFVSDDTAAAIRAGVHAVVDGLPDDALFGVVTVWWKPWIAVSLQRASHRGAIDGAIAGMDRGGGQEWVAGLGLAYDMLETVDASREVVVFVAEGHAEYTGDTLEAVERLRKRGVELDVVALPSVFRYEVEQMALAGGGVVLDAADVGQLAEVMPAAISGTAAAPPPAPR